MKSIKLSKNIVRKRKSKKYYAVIDTNVLVSSLLKGNSLPGIILKLIKNKTIIPLFNDEILNEYKEVLLRNKFGFSQEKVEKTLKIFESGINYTRTKTNELFFDEDDIVFYEIVLTSIKRHKNSYLITGNKKHYPNKFYVVNPREMIEIINIELDNQIAI